MTNVNAAASTEGFRFTPVSNQLAFASQDLGGLNSGTEYSFITTGGDDVQVTGTGIDFLSSPPAFGIAEIIEIDLSDNSFTQPDVLITSIDNQVGGVGARLGVIAGGAADFFFELMSSDDVLSGSDFDDIFEGGGGADEMAMGDGDDEAFGGIGDDEIDGGDDADRLNGEGGNDTLTGGDGDDTLDGGVGADDMDGGENDDIYIVDNAGDTAAEGISGVDLVQASVTHTLSANIENLTLTGFAAIDGIGNALANVIIDNVGDNVLSGLGGDDTLTAGFGRDRMLGGSGIDTLSGSFGNDTLDGGTGADNMDGGSGNDTYVVDNVGDVAAETAGGRDLVLSSVTHALSAGLENLTLTGAAASIGNGNALANIITGNAANNIMSGLGGSDILNGGAGADSMLGGSGSDTYVVDDAADVITEFAGGGTADRVNASVTATLAVNVENLTLSGAGNIDGTGNGSANVITGSTGANSLSGGGGADTLVGGGGLDTLTGGGGSDVFDFNAVTESGPSSAQADFIIGFDAPGAGGGDLIDLATIDAIGGGGDDAFTFLGEIQNPFPPATAAGSLFLRDEGGNTVVYGNIDGDIDPEFAIRISDGGVAPGDYDVADFVL